MLTKDWIFYGKKKRHLVQLGHSPYSGELIVRLNGINLFEDTLNTEETEKEFNFFVDDELCIIAIKRAPDQTFAYSFVSPDYSTSTTGKRRKLIDYLQKAGFAFFSLFFIGLLGFIFYQFISTNQKGNNDLSAGGIITTAYITHVANATIYYKFSVNGKTYRGQTNANLQNEEALAPSTALPIIVNGQFEVLFASNNPNKHLLYFDQPSAAQLDYYRIAAREACLKNTELHTFVSHNNKEVYCDCLYHYMYINYNLEGVAFLYHQNAAPNRLHQYNTNSFKTLMQSPLQQEIIDICSETFEKKPN